MDRLQKLGEQLRKTYDFIVIGAGAAGIQAAGLLAQHGKSFLVVEAQSVLGGRISTINIGEMSEAKGIKWIQSEPNVRNFQIEKGATWLESGHEYVFALCKKYGVGVREQYGEGNNLYLSKQRIYSSKQLLEDKEVGKKIFAAVKKFEELSETYGKAVLEDRKRTKTSDELLRRYDSMTVGEFMSKEFPDPFVRGFLENMIEHTECADCSKNSMHEVLTKNYCSNDIQIVKEFLGGDFGHESSYLINGGTELLLERMIREIEERLKRPRTDFFMLGCPVTAIDNKDPQLIKITVEHNSKPTVFHCRKVIVTVPIAVIKNIHIAKLSPAKKMIFENQLNTTSQKSFLLCKKPFWRKLGWSGDLLFAPEFNINMAHDISPEDESCGILVMFHNATKLVAWEKQFESSKSAYADKRQYFVKLLAKMFLNDDVNHPDLQDLVFKECGFTNDKYIRSCFQSNTKPGTFSKLLELDEGLDAYYRDEHGLVFAGSEYSDEFASYIEGAVRSARKKVHRELNLQDPLAAELAAQHKTK